MGIKIKMVIYSIHRRARFSERPHQFATERWLSCREGDKCKQDGLQRKYVVSNPFRFGRHSCPGEDMALVELSLAVTTLLWEFDFEEVAVK